MALAFSSFDLVTRQDLRRDFVAKFVKRPMGTALDLIIFTLMLGFLGLMFLSGISIGPQKSDLYILLPFGMIVVWVLKVILRK